MTSTTFFIATAIISSIGSYFLVKSDATKLNKENFETKIIDERVGSVLVALTFVCIISALIMFGWKTGLICFIIWFLTSAITGYIIKIK